MEKPKVSFKQPANVKLNAGKIYFWCRCGHSKNQPFCDGSHKTTSFTPLKFVPEKDEDAYLCQCKNTKNPPYCDGTHKTL